MFLILDSSQIVNCKYINWLKLKISFGIILALNCWDNVKYLKFFKSKDFKHSNESTRQALSVVMIMYGFIRFTSKKNTLSILLFKVNLSFDKFMR